MKVKLTYRIASVLLVLFARATRSAGDKRFQSGALNRS
jgi:hypothetical protein